MQSPQSLKSRDLLLFGVEFLALSWALVYDGSLLMMVKSDYGLGPAHAVYFATYEAVKQAMGGNNGIEHHPLAAGELKCSLLHMTEFLFLM